MECFYIYCFVKTAQRIYIFDLAKYNTLTIFFSCSMDPAKQLSDAADCQGSVNYERLDILALDVDYIMIYAKQLIQAMATCTQYSERAGLAAAAAAVNLQQIYLPLSYAVCVY